MTEPTEPFSLWRHRPFTLFWLARGSTSMASQIMTIALGWQVYALTSNPLNLGLVGLAQFIPAFLLALPAGHAIDRYQRRTVLRLCFAVDGLVVLFLALASAADVLTVSLIYPLAALLGAARAFEGPAGSALLAGLVPRDSFGPAIAWDSSVRQTATIVGPAIGGVLYALGPTAAYAACTVAYGISLAFAASLPQAAPAAPREPPTLRSVFAGLAFIWREKTVLGAISLDLFAVLLGGATALLPVYARDILVTGPLGLGVLRAAPAVGALVIATALARWPLARHSGRVLFVSVALFGVATCVFAVSRSIGVSLAALVLLGASDMISVFIRLTLVQLRTPDAMRGRVSSVNMIFIGTSNQLGEFESGLTAHWFGTVPAVMLGGVGTLVVVALWAALFPSLRKIDRLQEVEAAVA